MKKTISLEINASFGSKFQKETALDALALMLKAWTQFYELNHKKNKIEFKVKEEK